MADIEKILESVSSGNYDAKQLINLFNNAMKYPAISEHERETVIEAVELELRKNHSRIAKKKFGAVGNRPREVLEEISGAIEQEFDLSLNRVKNGVKTGGPMISGEGYIDMYLSYKNSAGIGVVVGAYQWAADSPLKYKVFQYDGANRPDNISDLTEYLEESDEILPNYRRLLSKVLDQS